MGACIYIEDKDFEPNTLREILIEMLENPIKIKYLKQNSNALAKFDATEKIVNLIKE